MGRPSVSGPQGARRTLSRRKLGRRQSVEQTVLPVVVVVIADGLAQIAAVEEVKELVSVKAFVEELSVEARDADILGGFSQCDFLCARAGSNATPDSAHASRIRSSSCCRRPWQCHAFGTTRAVTCPARIEARASVNPPEATKVARLVGVRRAGRQTAPRAWTARTTAPPAGRLAPFPEECVFAPIRRPSRTNPSF